MDIFFYFSLFTWRHYEATRRLFSAFCFLFIASVLLPTHVFWSFFGNSTFLMFFFRIFELLLFLFENLFYCDSLPYAKVLDCSKLKACLGNQLLLPKDFYFGLKKESPFFSHNVFKSPKQK